MYSVSTQPLLQELSNTVANDAVKQVCFPDDNFAVRPLQGFKMVWLLTGQETSLWILLKTCENHPNNK